MGALGMIIAVACGALIGMPPGAKTLAVLMVCLPHQVDVQRLALSDAGGRAFQLEFGLVGHDRHGCDHSQDVRRARKCKSCGEKGKRQHHRCPGHVSEQSPACGVHTLLRNRMGGWALFLASAGSASLTIASTGNPLQSFAELRSAADLHQDKVVVGGAQRPWRFRNRAPGIQPLRP